MKKFNKKISVLIGTTVLAIGLIAIPPGFPPSHNEVGGATPKSA